MSFASFADFLAMGGHGLYVWLSYGATALVLLANVMGVRISRRHFLRESHALEMRAVAGVESARAEKDAKEALTRNPPGNDAPLT